MYSSTGLSFGFAQAFFVASLAGSPTFVFDGGIGCMNHLSYIFAISPDFIIATSWVLYQRAETLYPPARG